MKAGQMPPEQLAAAIAHDLMTDDQGVIANGVILWHTDSGGMSLDALTERIDKHLLNSVHPVMPPIDLEMRDRAIAEHLAGESIDGETLLKQTQALVIARQVVDWPDAPGWWWMDAAPFQDSELIRYDDELDRIRFSSCYFGRDMAIEWNARFLPAHLPTFPPREKG